MYSNSFNTNSLFSVDLIDVSDLIVQNSLVITGAQLSFDQYDNVTIGFENNQLYVKNFAMTSNILTPQNYIPFKDTTSPENNTVKVYIHPTGVSITKFVMQD